MTIFDSTSLAEEKPTFDNIFSVTSINPSVDTAQSRLTNSADGNPEQAAKSIHIGNDLGVPPQAVDQDFDTFSRTHGIAAASTIVGESPALVNYINSHPLAATVSKDDWANLDGFVKAARKFSPSGIVGAGVEAFAKSLWHAPALGEWRDPTQALDYDRFGGWKLLGAPIELTGRLISAGLEGVHAATKEMEDQFELSPNFARDITGMFEHHLISGGIMHNIITPDVVAQTSLNMFLKKVEPYVHSGEPIPVGLHPVTDSIHAEQAKMDSQVLKDALSAATKTETREIAPDLFQDSLTKDVVGGAEIGVSAEAVRKLYGDKVPAPDDGMLGWVPRLEEQLAAAEVTGGDVQVPLASWLARVDPAVARELQDSVRLREGGVTPEEAKAGIEAYHGSPYEFESFDIGKAGTGEGAQSYGFGHYVAEAEGVARQYQRDTTPKATMDRLNELDRKLENMPEGNTRDALLAELYDLEQRSMGNLYRTRILRQPEEFLDWDKPLAEQSPQVKDAISKLGEPGYTKMLEEEGVTGGSFAQTHMEDVGDKVASKALSDAGIAGIKYLDQFSRDAVKLQDQISRTKATIEGLTGEARATAETNIAEWERQAAQPTRNFVVFNDADIQVLERNGEVIKSLREANRLEPAPPTTKAKQLELPQDATTRMEDRRPFEPAPPGFTVATYKKYLAAIERLRSEDAEAVRKWAMEDARRAETKDWREARVEMRKDVSAELSNNPAQRLDEMIRSGQLIQTKGLTEEQISVIPKKNRSQFTQRGVSLDDLAKSLDVSSGEVLANSYLALEKSREASGMKPKEYLGRRIDAETGRRMEAEHGDLGQRILDRAMERVLAETQLDILHEETLAYASNAGLQFSISKDELVAAAKDAFNNRTVGQTSSKRLLADVGRAGRKVEAALLDAKPDEAFREAQKREIAFIQAKEAARVEKEVKQFEKTAKKFRNREVDNIPAEFTNAIQSILQKLGMKVKRTPSDLIREIQGTGYTDLADWVAKKEKEYQVEGVKFDVPDFLLEQGFNKAVDDLSIYEFRGVKQAVDILNHFGRGVEKIEVEGAKLDREALVQRMRGNLTERFPALSAPMTKRRTETARDLFKTALAASTSLETVFSRFDGRDPNGIFTKTFVYPGAEAANHLARLQREYGAEMKALGEVKDGRKLLTAPMVDPKTGQPLKNFTRLNLAAIISNMGNQYNWKVMTEGWKVNPDVLWDWVIKNSTREDFDRAFALSKVFNKAKDASDIVYRNLYGVAPENIEVHPFEAHGKAYPGWYHPIIRDPKRSRLSLLESRDPLEGGPTTYWPSTPNSYVKRRSGAVDVLDLTYNMIPVKLNQMLHDVAMRNFVHNASKIIRYDKFRDGVTQAYGIEYVEEMDQWLNRVAGSASYNSLAMRRASAASNFLRQNVVTTHIAFGLTTVQKHGATAAVMSAKELGSNTFAGMAKLLKLTGEVGMDSFYHATMDLFGRDPHLGESLSKFINRNSEEIQRRERHFQDTVMDASYMLEGKTSIRQMAAYYGAKAVAMSDKISAKPLWLGKYREVLDETGDHGQAVAQANFSVRRAHGSTAITSLPRIATGGGILEPWMTTLYGFMGANMQRRLEIAHDINDAYKLGRSGEIKAAIKQIPGITDSIMANVVWVGIVEEAVVHQFTDDKRGLLERALPFVVGTLAQTIVGLRDLAWGLAHGREPQVGLINAPLSEITNVIRDMKKPHPLSRQNAGKFVGDSISAVGDITGVGPRPVGRSVRYGIDVYNRQQRPKTLGDIYRGVVSGRQQMKVEK